MDKGVVRNYYFIMESQNFYQFLLYVCTQNPTFMPATHKRVWKK